MAFPYALVQTANGNVGGVAASTLIVAYAGNVTKGDLLIAYWSTGGSTSTEDLYTITDTQGNVWAAAASTLDFQASADSHIWYAIAKTTGACTVTITFTPGTNTKFFAMILAEYSIQNAVLDQTSGISVGKSPVPPQHNPNAITTTQPNELIVAGAGDGSSPTIPWTVDEGFTVDGQQDNAGDNAGYALASLNAAASLTTTQPTFSHAGFVFSITVAQCSFFGAAAPGGPTQFEISFFGTKRFGKSPEAKCQELPERSPVKLFEVE